MMMTTTATLAAAPELVLGDACSSRVHGDIICGHAINGSWAYAATIVETSFMKPAFANTAFTNKDHSQRKRPT